ncbi:unnamed protein product [Pylaiella littoralis]
MQRSLLHNDMGRPGPDHEDSETQLGGGSHPDSPNLLYQRAGYADPMEYREGEQGYSAGNDDRDNELQQHRHRRPDRFSWFVLKLTVTSALGGFLFGYDTGVVSGAMLLIKDDFSLSNWQEEVIVSVTIVAAVTAAVSGGPAMEQWGRRPLILLAAIIFTIGAVMLAAANSYGTLVAGRLVVGVGIGLASLTTPVYIAEAAPSHIRGRLVTLNTLFITVGQVVAGVVDGLFSGTDSGWRYMLGLSGVPSFFMTLGFLFLPESPRWLLSAGRRREALSVLQRIRGSSDVHMEMEEMIDAATDKDSGGLKASITARGLLEDPRIRRALVLGCGLQLLQQLSGINTVMYYSASIFSMAGFSDQASIWLAAVTAAAQSVGVCIGIYFIEKCGRRSLVLSSLGMVSAALVLLGFGFYLYDDAVAAGQSASAERYAYVVVATMMGYLFTFGVGMSSVPWTVNAEIYPNHARSLGTSASTTVNWIGNVVVSATFLTLAADDALGKDGAFWLYAFVAVAGWGWLYFCMPETKGLSLEEIELLFARSGDPPRPGEAEGEGSSGDGVGGARKTSDPVALSSSGGGWGFELLEGDADEVGGSGGGNNRAGAGAGWIDPNITGGDGGSSKLA